MGKKLLLFFLLSLSFLPTVVWAKEGPPSHITSLQIMEKAAENYFKYTHYKVIGVCMWWKCRSIHNCGIYTTLELDEHIPDLLVSVYNGKGDNPWIEGDELYDQLAYAAGNETMKMATGHELGDGNTNETSGSNHFNSLRARSVDVIGNPVTLIKTPLPSLKVDTKPYMPYYQSDIDSVSDRFGIAEAIRPETYNIFGHYIGSSFINHWAYEFPRTMAVDNNNNYKASIVAALHAADIVTNKNTMHVVKSVSDSCGKNCAVANVIEEQKDDHEIWEEIYPKDHHIKLGEDDSLSLHSIGSSDDQKGNGNYVFVIWRHYRGCVQHEGKLIWSSVKVPDTKKR